MKRFLTILSVLALALSVSCVTETELEPVSSDETLVTFTMQLPYTNGEAATRAITPTPGEENQISSVTVWALIQRGGVWVYNYAATNISQAISGNDMVITATVRELSSAQQFVIITNSATEVAAAAPYLYEPYTAVEDRLVTATGGGEWPARLNGTGTFSPIPMYARTDAQVVSASSNNNIGPYQLLRMVARINVTLASSILSSNFTLEEATLFNYKTAGYITHGKSGFSVNKVTTPAVPTSGDHTGTPILQPTAIYLSDKGTDTRGTILNSIYTFESPAIVLESAKQTGTALVVGGYYNGSSTMSYYRIDLKTTDDASSNVSSGILRNHSYNVEIQSVTGPGYGSEIDAYKGANQLSAKVVAWNDAVQQTILDGSYYLTVDKDEFYYTYKSGQGNVVATTDYDRTDRGYPKGVVAYEAEIVYTPAVALGDEWLELVDVAGTNGSLTRTIGMKAEQNQESTYRYAKVYIKAGNMSKVINITQEPFFIAPFFARSNIVMVLDGSGKKILTFAETDADHTGKTVKYDNSSTAVMTSAIPANVQGLLFRWGSLVGFSSDFDTSLGVSYMDFTSNDVVFWPDLYAAPATWDPSSTATTDKIPWIENYANDALGFDSIFDLYSTKGGYDEDEGLGDICRYITGKDWVEGRWRIPNAKELQMLHNETTYAKMGYSFNGVSYGSYAYQSINNTYGFEEISSGWLVGSGVDSTDDVVTLPMNPNGYRVFLPASGYRGRAAFSTAGSLTVPGGVGYYQSSTSYGSQIYQIFLSPTDFRASNPAWPGVKDTGMSIRCIRETYD